MKLTPKIRDWYSTGWRMQGQQKESRDYRTALRKGGMETAESWDKAVERYPLTDETVIELGELKKQERDNAKRKGKVVRERYERATKVENRTGIELFDWVYSNLGFAAPRTVGPAVGDVGFLKWCRENRDEFYRKFYLPALMKNKGLGPNVPEIPDGCSDPSELSTESLLKSLTEASG